MRPRARPLEALLLLLAGGITLAAALPLQLASGDGVTVPAVAAAAALFVAFGLLHVLLTMRGRGEDPVLIPLCLALMGIGLAFARRLAPGLAERQQLFVFAGVAVIAAAVWLPGELRRLRHYRYSAAAAGVVLVGLTFVFGRSAVGGGPRLWLGIGPIGFQPAEALKPLLVLFLAGYLGERRELLGVGGPRVGPMRFPVAYLAPLGLVVGAALALLAAQGDLGAALLLVTVALGMWYLAVGRGDLLLVALLLFAIGAWWMHGHVPIVQARTALWLDPWSDPQGGGFQLVQAVMAMSAGGILGSGLGFGQPTAIPAVHTDFVYAAIVEEMGMAGAAAVLAMYGLLLVRGLRVAARCEDPFKALLAAGLTFALFAQALLIVAGDVRLMPLTGITLPFVAHGGSSMLVSAASVGLVLRISGSSSRPRDAGPS
jgi:cell division protein FtsW (lipid II flippase)